MRLCVFPSRRFWWTASLRSPCGAETCRHIPTVIKDGNGNPFPGNQIPASMISPLAASALKYLFPLPNTGAANSLVNNYVTNFPTPIKSNQGDVRVDQEPHVKSDHLCPYHV